MFRNTFKFVMAVCIGCLLWSTSAPEASAKGKHPNGQKKVVVHKEVVATPYHKAFVHRNAGRPPEFRPMHFVIPRVGYQWIPGRWSWDERFNHWVWIEGRYIQHRQGYRYEPGYWVETGRGFRWIDGRWLGRR